MPVYAAGREKASNELLRAPFPVQTGHCGRAKRPERRAAQTACGPEEPPAESRAARYGQAACSDVEAEEYDVAVADNVILALAADQSGLLRGVERALFHQRVEADDLGADEPALKVGVNLPRRARRLRPLRDGPRAHLLRASGQIADQPQQAGRRSG